MTQMSRSSKRQTGPVSRFARCHLIWRRKQIKRCEQQRLIDTKMMHRAIELAKRAESLDEVPVGAVVVYQGQIIGEGYNLRESQNDPMGHAELMAIRDATLKLKDWRLNQCTLYVTLEPCPMCAGAIINARVGRLVYGASDPKMGCVDSLYHLCNDQRFNHQTQVTSGVLAKPCGQMLTRFFRRKRRKRKRGLS